MPQGKTMEISRLRAICSDFSYGYSYSFIKEKRKPISKSTLQKIKEKLVLNNLLDPVNLLAVSDKDLITIMYGPKAYLEKSKNKQSVRIVIDRNSSERIDNEAMHPAHFEDLVIRFEDHKHLTKEDLYRDYVEEAVAAGHEYYKRTAFMQRLNQLIDQRKGPDVYMHREHAYGDELEMDWVGQRFSVRTGAYGETTKYAVIVFVWAASNYVFAQLCPDLTTNSACAAIKNALQFYNCKPKRLVIDNQACLVNRHRKGQEAILNENFAYFCERCGIGVDANNPRSGNEKSAAENTVRLVEQRVLARLTEGDFSVAEYNARILELVNKYINRTSFRGGGVNDSRECLFKRHELPAALRIDTPLPSLIEHFPYVKVGNDYHVEINGVKYSVNWRYAGRLVNVDVEGRMVTIYDFNRTEVLARHPAAKEGIVTNPEHMPENHKAVREKEVRYKKPQDIMDDAVSLSIKLASYCKFILSKDNWAENKKSCICIINLYRRNRRKHIIYDQAIDRLLHQSNTNLINSYELKKYIKDLEDYAAENNGAIPVQTEILDLKNLPPIDSDKNAASLRGAAGFSDFDGSFSLNQPETTKDQSDSSKDKGKE